MMPEEGRDSLDAAASRCRRSRDAAADGGLDEQAHAVLQGAGGKLCNGPRPTALLRSPRISASRARMMKAYGLSRPCTPRRCRSRGSETMSLVPEAMRACSGDRAGCWRMRETSTSSTRFADDLVDSLTDGAIAEKGDLHGPSNLLQVCVHGYCAQNPAGMMLASFAVARRDDAEETAKNSLTSSTRVEARFRNKQSAGPSRNRPRRRPTWRITRSD